MKPSTLLMVTAFGWVLCSKAVAEPTLYPQNLNVLSGVVNQTDSNILADEADPKTVWVLPPNKASAVVTGLHSKTANMGFCGEMKDLIGYSRDLSREISELNKKRAQKQGELQKLQDRASELHLRAERYAAERNLQALAELDNRISTVDQRLSELYQSAETCNTTCDEINEEISINLKAKNQMMIDRNKLARENAADVREYTKRRKAAEAAQKAVSDFKAVFNELDAELRAVRNRFLDSYRGFGEMEGARAAFRYTSHWDDNVQKLRERNPGINFSKMATQNAKLMSEIAGLGEVNPQGAIRTIALAGRTASGVAEFPQYPQDLSTNVVLSLIGACPMEHPEYFDLAENDVKDMQYGVIITYEYETVFRMKARAEYNMYKMYEKIVSSGKRGGLFSSRSWSKVEEKNFFRDSFNVAWDDRENTVTPEEKEEIEAEMRKNVLHRLATLALPTSPVRAELISAMEPPPRGAVVVSNELMKTCPGNVYCVAGAAVMRVLDAIFGSSSSTSSYTNIQDVQIVDDYSRTSKIKKAWITSYL